LNSFQFVFKKQANWYCAIAHNQENALLHETMVESVFIMLPDKFPDSLQACHALLGEQTKQLAQQQELADLLQKTLDDKEELIDKLQVEVKLLKRTLFGSRRERFVADDPNQTYLFGEANLQGGGENEGESETENDEQDTPPRAPRTSKGRGRRVFPDTIPRRRVDHRLADDELPEDLDDRDVRRFFKKTREELEYIPASLVVVEHFQEILALENPLGETEMLSATLPASLLERCYVGPSVLAMIATNHFADHLPYYREEDILDRIGFRIHRSTQWRWMRGVAEAMTPLVFLMHRRIMHSHVIQMDETTIPLLDPNSRKTVTSYLWQAYGDDRHPYNCFWFSRSRSRDAPESILSNFRGVLYTDAYSAYESLACEFSDRLQWSCCLAHARRKFEEIEHAGPNAKARYVLSLMQKLYDIEDRARTMSVSERQALRDRESRPLWSELREWLDEKMITELPKSRLRGAMEYLLNRWHAFVLYLDDGAIPIDNNRCEAVFKDPILGRKNWLFLGNEDSGMTSAIMYTLTSTCKRLCIDPLAYLLDVFERIPSASAIELRNLLPDRWLARHPESRIQQRVIEAHAAAERKRLRREGRRRAAA
jgi:transposase